MSKVGNTTATTAQISEDTKSLLLKANLITAEQIQSGVTVELTKDKINDAVASGVLTLAEGKQLISTLSLTGATGGLSTALIGLGATIKATTTAMWAFLTTTPVGWAILVAAAAAGALAIHDALTVSVKEATEALNDSIESINSVNDEVKSLEDELTTSKDKIKELQDQINNGANTATYETELGLLRDQTDELERQLAIKKEEQRITAKDTAEDAENNYNAEFFSKYNSSGQTIAGTSVISHDPAQELSNTIQALKNFRDEYKKTEDELAKNSAAALFNSVAHPDLGIKAHPEMTKLNEKAAESNQKELERLDKQMDEASAHALEFYNLLNLQKQALDGLTEAGYNLSDEEKYRYAYVNSMMQAYQNYLNTVNEVIKVSSAAGSIQNAKTSMGYAESDTDPQTFGQLIDSAQTFQESINSAGEALNKLTSGDYTASDLLTYISNINDAMKKMGKEVDWESISSIDELKDKIQELADSYVDTFLAKNDIDADSDFAEMLRGIVNEATNASNSIDSLNSSIDSLQSAYSSLTSIVDEYNSTGTLTLDNLQTLLSLEPEYLNCLISENGQLALNSDALSILLNQRLNDARAQAVQNAITQINTLTEEANATAKENNGTAAENAKIKIDDYNLSLSDTVKKAFLSAGAVSTLNAALDGASDAGVSEEAIQNVMDTFEAQLGIIDQIGASSVDSALATKKSAKSTKEAADEHIKAFEEEHKLLKSIREQGKITEKDYLDQLRKLYIRYFKDRKKYLEEYEKYEHEYLDGLKTLYEKVFSSIGKVIDKQIDKYKDQKDAAVDALEKEKDAAEKALEARKEALETEIKSIDKQISYKEKIIDGIQDEIDAIQDSNDERERAIDLQKKEYELARAQNQRTQLVYQNGQMTWRTDPNSIRDAKQDVEDAKTEIAIADKEKQIKQIEREISVLEERKDALQEQQDEIEKLINKSNDYYDNMISQTEEYWDKLIKGFEDYKEKWEDIGNLVEEAEIDEFLKNFDITREDILNKNEDALKRISGDYLTVLADIYSGNNSMLDSLSQLTGENMHELTGYLENTQGYIDSLNSINLDSMETALGSIATGFGNVSTAAGEATNAISGTGSTTPTPGDTSSSSGADSSSFSNAITSGSDEAVTSLGDVSSAFAGDEDGSVKGAVNQVTEAIGSGEQGSEESNGESTALSPTLQEHIQYATSEEGIPSETSAFRELSDTMGDAQEHLEGIKTLLFEMDGKTFTVTVEVNHNQSGTGQVSAYSKGGLITNRDKSTLDPFAKALGEDHMVAVQEGEIILSRNQISEITAQQNSKNTPTLTPLRNVDPEKYNMLMAFSDLSTSINRVKMTVDNFEKQLAKSVNHPEMISNQSKKGDTNINFGDITLQNVQSPDKLAKAIVNTLPLKIVQELHKR